MAPSPTLRRLLREVTELSPSTPNPNPTFHAAPVTDSDLHEWHFILLGPPSPSPYAGGLYHGRISLPPTYPLKPPNFRFLTPSGRFEVNREICLSISGFHEETWMPAWGVRTALVALRSFMAEEGTAGQVGGLEANKEVRKRLARESRSWKCRECSADTVGGRTNEEVMREWWEVCRSKGVKVEEGEEGIEFALEALPEGMDVEVRARGGTQTTENEKKKDGVPSTESSSRSTTTTRGESTQAQHAVDINSTSEDKSIHNPSVQTTAPSLSSNTPSQPQPQPQSQRSIHTPQPSISNSIPPQSQPQSPTSPTRYSPSTSTNTPTSPHPPSSPQQTTTTSQPNPISQPTPTPTLDRAITGIFIALIVMILKKMFYPASSSSSSMGYRDDGVWMVRE